MNKAKVKKVISFLKPLFIRVIIGALIGLLLMTAVYMIPTDRINENVKKAASIFKEEGAFYNMFPWCTSQVDNFTDTIILLEAAYDGEESTIEKAMEVKRETVANWNNPWMQLLLKYIYGIELPDTISYARYWHGYLAIVKPLLSLIDYSTFRIVNSLIQITLIVSIIYLLVKNNMKAYILPYLLAMRIFDAYCYSD